MRTHEPAFGPFTLNQVQAALAALGVPYPAGQPAFSTLVPPSPPGFPLTKVQGEIVSALTKKPVLNPRQVTILEIHWKATTSGGQPLSVDAVGARLVAEGGAEPNQATDFVRGSLRSFGRRLRATLTKVPVQIGKDMLGDGVADEIPLLAMFDISKGATGEVRHRLTHDGMIAVQAALGMNGKGNAAGSVTGEDHDPEEMVTLGMSQGAAALIMRVAASKGMGVDETVRLMTAMMGAG